MDLSVVIVNYQTFDLTRNTINSILKYEYPFSYEIIVVDNASEDNSLSNLKDYFKDSVKFISSKENNGFAAGNNQGLRIASGKYILLLNSDTVVWENTLEKIYNFMENNPFVGACGCRVLLADGTLDKACKRSFPNVKNSFYRLFHIPTNSKEHLFLHVKNVWIQLDYWMRHFSCMVKILIYVIGLNRTIGRYFTLVRLK